MKKLVLTFAVVLLPFIMLGQEATEITGSVVDGETGIPIPSVNVIEKGTSNGTMTDFDGNFTLSVAPNAVLEVSFLGYATKEVQVDNQTQISIQLSPEASSLEEIVVVGYGTQKKGSVTAAVSQIDGDLVKKSPVANISNALAGRLPGLKITQRSGEPGYDGADINLRGFGNPLVIVDGVPRSFTSIDPNTIESISVLKDASAAVYGVRAANGVLLVTTKQGKIGKPKITLNAYTGFQSPTRYPDLLNAAEFAELTDESQVNQGREPVYGREEVENYRNNVAGFESTNWYNTVIQDQSPQQYYNLNVSGASEDVKYFMSAGYLQQEGMWKSGDTNYERFNISSNLEAKITDNLTASMNISARLENRDYPGAGAATLMSGILRNYPTYSPYADPEGNYYGLTNQAHQNVALLMNKDQSGYTEDRRKVFNGNLTLNYEIPGIEGLSAKLRYAYGTNVKRVKGWTQKYNLYAYDEASDEYVVDYVGNDPSSLSESYSSGYYENDLPGNYNQMQVSLNYENTFAEKHNVKGLVLFETLENEGDDFSAYREFLLDLDYLFAGLDENKDNGGGAYELASAGLVGRFNYDFDEKYLLEAGFRYDGSSKFPSESRWGFFPFVSGGWVLTKEDFLEEPLSFFDNLKLRASWGQLGDDSASEFQFITGYNYPSGNYIFGNSVVPGLTDRGLANRNITWFEAETTDIGFDATFLDRQIDFTFDWFYRKRSGLLATRASSLPGSFGSALPQENLNSDETQGFDLSVSYRTTIAEDFKLNVTGNYGYSRSKDNYVERADFVNSLNRWRNDKTGRWKNVTWGYEALGQFQSQEEIDNWAVQDDKGNTTLLPGDIKYLDYNNDGVINDDDIKPIGKGTTPEITYGLNLAMQWKGFDLSAQLQGAANFVAYYDGELQNPFYNGANSLAVFKDRWHREDIYDPNSEWIPGKFPSTIASGNPNNKKYSSFWLKDASYLRLKNIELGYSLPRTILDEINVDEFRIYISGYNLVTWDQIEFLDPEAPTGRGTYYPQQKIVNLGVNLTL
ncbi:TonB-linked outer membrane protein, SusC/RagA family [Salegentibacter echinorum]|uniref:TonB-linked outer membrane protein, SusC/RagA family n=1 Tax=Salegentibacter echinorum TaxID=1073325 RepID=A0A1M5EA40_SALEC|nr:TonB-dependent receptor [Salegentibacter echinorum]SHF76109.1 TonB-linked outer membrane protein, SusC/RagA family [Salegentibacter echinorum]